MQPVNGFALKRIVAAVWLAGFTMPAWAEDAPAAVAAAADWLPVYPQISVNGRSADLPVKLLEQDKRLLVRAADLHALGIRIPAEVMAQAARVEAKEAPLADASPVPNLRMPSEKTEPDTPQAKEEWLDLASIGNLQTAYDSAEQTLLLTAPLSWLNLPLQQLGNAPEAAYRITRPGFAGVFNYDTNFTRNNNGGFTQGLVGEARLTTPWGYLNHTRFWNRSSGNGQNSNNSAALETYWRTTFPEKGLQLTLGDISVSALGGSGNTLMGGVKLAKTYSVQPWRNTAPLRAYLGETTLPGTVDLYIDGVKQQSRQIDAGQYSLPLPTGIGTDGTAQVVATDILGRTVVVDLPLYGNGNGLLAKGLNEWSIEAGALRRNYGVKSFDYASEAAASGNIRYGLSNFVTVSAHAEGARGYAKAGAGANILLGRAGQLNLTHQQSRFQGQTGRFQTAYYNKNLGDWSVGFGASRSDDRFTSLSAVLSPESYQPEGNRNRTASASLGWNNQTLGYFSLSYLFSEGGGESAEKIGTLSWSRSFGRRVSLSAGGSTNFGERKQNSIYGGLHISLDRGYAFGISGSRNSGEGNSKQISLSKSSNGLNSPYWNIGWQQQTRSDGQSSSNLTANIQYNTQYADTWASLHNAADNTQWSAGARGGLVLMSGGLFPARPVSDSFAVVDTGMPDVTVTAANNTVGKTNRKGLLLVPNLFAHQKNQIGIDTLDLPENIVADRTQSEIIPADHAGMNVKFKLKKVQSGTLTLKDQNGAFIESGSIITAENGENTIVGFDGESYLENLAAGENRFTVSLSDGQTCRFSLSYPETESSEIKQFGDVVCTP
ncbi:fimbria/pilus outer membrane usher protein [Neisseria chenwenguii]|uniref:fimbria/pilus outer membrane usher protein n=1 Tax=Neisseria chenwenguii TaxID=1853278 RepID=UPI000F50F2D0|nr:fimbria/pilus outer membrane usher protein [Neisseria chenwenguii]